VGSIYVFDSGKAYNIANIRFYSDTISEVHISASVRVAYKSV